MEGNVERRTPNVQRRNRTVVAGISLHWTFGVGRSTFGVHSFPMSESPYRTIAVASTFSPRFLHVLTEAKRVRGRLGRELHVIYVGEQNEETTRKFQDAFRRLDLPADSPIHYRQGDPADAILQAINGNEIDLVVAGALQKEQALLTFLGNVARRLVREADCSVMLFTTPETEPKPLRRIVFMVDYSEHGKRAFRDALHLAKAESSERLYAIRVHTSFDEARASRRDAADDGADAPESRTLEEEEAALEEFILAAGVTEVPIEARCVRGNTGYAASDFVQSVESDLLVVPVERQNASSQLPAHFAWVTDVIPCNLWVIR